MGRHCRFLHSSLLNVFIAVGSISPWICHRLFVIKPSKRPHTSLSHSACLLAYGNVEGIDICIVRHDPGPTRITTHGTS